MLSATALARFGRSGGVALALGRRHLTNRQRAVLDLSLDILQFRDATLGRTICLSSHTSRLARLAEEPVLQSPDAARVESSSAALTLTDAGPLIALIDADETDHERCRATLSELRLPLLSTWAAFTEAMYLLGQAGGRPGQEALWRLVLRNDLLLATLSAAATQRAAELMARYADRPMDLADATLLALAEERDLKLIFTLDDDFHIYRRNDRQHFEVVP